MTTIRCWQNTPRTQLVVRVTVSEIFRNCLRYVHRYKKIQTCEFVPRSTRETPFVERYQGKVSRIYFRADAAFAMPEVYEYLEAERIKYAIRLPANQVLQNRIGYLLKRPVGRPPNEVRRYYANFTYQAGSWTKPRRVIAKVEWHA